MEISRIVENIRIVEENSPAEIVSSSSRPPQHYTSYAEDLPRQISYQNIKLANYIELQLVDLEHTIVQHQRKNLPNPIKDCLSRSYNIFHQMEKLYRDLGMSFLYSQVKKLISCYGVMFVILTSDKKQEKSPPSQNSQTLNQSQRRSGEKLKRSRQSVTGKMIPKKSYNKLGGIHLFNENYNRYIDYDIQQFRALRKKNEQKNITAEDAQKLRKECDKKFKQQVLDEINENSYLNVEGEEILTFLQQKRNLNLENKHISLGDELEKIATFFKQSQIQALQFLRKSKNQESFHELTQGFNTIVEDYKNNKNLQVQFIKKKLKELYFQIRQKNSLLEIEVSIKDQELSNLKNQIAEKELKLMNAQVQTLHNFDEQIYELHKRNEQFEATNQQLKKFLKKNLDEQKKQKIQMLSIIAAKEKAMRSLNQKIQQKNLIIGKLERRNKLAMENLKNQNSTNPIDFFNSLNVGMKKVFFEELKDQGFISPYESNKLMKNLQHEESQYHLPSDSVDEDGFNDFSPHKKIDLKRYSDMFKKNLKRNQSILNSSPKSSANEKSIIYKERLTKGHEFEEKQQKYYLQLQKQKQLRDLNRSKRQIIIPKTSGPDHQSSNQDGKIRVFEIHSRDSVVNSPHEILDKQFIRAPSRQKSTHRNRKGVSERRKSRELTTYPNNENGNNSNLPLQQIKNKSFQSNKPQLKDKQNDSNEEKEEFSKKIKLNLNGKTLNQIADENEIQRQRKQKRFSIKQKQINKQQMKRSMRKQRKNIILQKKKQDESQQQQHRQKQQKYEINQVELTKDLESRQNVKSEIFRQTRKPVNFQISNSFNLVIFGNRIQLQENTPIIREDREIWMNKQKKKNFILGIQMKKKTENQLKLPERQDKIQNRAGSNIMYSEEVKPHKSMLQVNDKGSCLQKKDIEKKDSSQIEKMQKTITKSGATCEFMKKQENQKTKSTDFKKKGKNQNKKEVKGKRQSLVKQKISNQTKFKKQAKMQEEKESKEINMENSERSTIFEGITPFKNSFNSSEIEGRDTFHQQQQERAYLQERQEEEMENQAIGIARKFPNFEDYKEELIKIHLSSCGKYCRHLQRYFDNFVKYKNSTYRTTIKMHIENINEHIIQDQSETGVTLPVIMKK